MEDKTPATPAAGDVPYAYACPAKCGCIWRDNHDGTMSLFGKNSQSCEMCEPLPLDKLIPLYTAAIRAEAQPAIGPNTVRDYDGNTYVLGTSTGQPAPDAGKWDSFEAWWNQYAYSIVHTKHETVARDAFAAGQQSSGRGTPLEVTAEVLAEEWQEQHLVLDRKLLPAIVELIHLARQSASGEKG